MIQIENLEKIQQKLEEDLARIMEHMAVREEMQDGPLGVNLDRDDLARNFAKRERQRALHDAEKTQLTQIEKALERLMNGSYGTCASCGEAISPERLEIIPYATLCIRCQQKQEQI
jgi:DnaK suppressor protein